MDVKPCRYRFEDIEIDAGAHQIRRGGAELAVEPKAFAVLLVLLANAGRTVSRDDLLDQVWGHRHVTPGVLNRVVAQLRKALGDDAEHPRFIQTLHSLGYRFIAPLHDEACTPEPSAVPAPPAEPPKRERREQDRRIDPPRVPPDPTRRSAGAELGAPDPVLAGAQSRDSARSPIHPWAWLAGLILLATAAGLSMVWRERGSLKPAAASIAVLPFINLGEGAQDDYFAQGLTIEIRDALAGVPGLRVAAALSPSAVKQWPDARAIGRAQGVATVLDASIRRDGPRVRISAHLSDTVTGFLLWSEVYDRESGDVLLTQSEIAAEVAHALRGVLPNADPKLVQRRRPTENLAAFEAYLRGLEALNRENPEGSQAVAFFSQALHADTAFVAAQVGICRAELWRFESSHEDRALDTARGSCLKAERMDPASPLVRLALADLYRVQGDAARARSYYRPLLDDPARRAAALVGMARLEAASGRQTTAIQYLWQALDARPGDATIYAELGYQQYQGGDLSGAISTYAKLIELRPNDANDRGTYGALLLAAGKRKQASAALLQSIALGPTAAALSNLATLRYQAGDFTQASTLYRQATDLEPENYQLWGFLGDALLNDANQLAEAKSAYAEATRHLLPFLRLRPDDAQAAASYAWYQANLDQPDRALEYATKSASLATDLGQVALLNAQTYARLGKLALARSALALARARGVDPVQIETNPVLKKVGLLTAPSSDPE